METAEQIQTLKKVGRKEKIIILVLLLLAFIVGFIAAFVYLKPKIASQNQPPGNTQITQPRASLALSTPTVNLTTGTEFDVAINVSSLDKGIDAADIFIYYDSRFLTYVSLAHGNYFQNYLSERIDNSSIKFSAAASLNKNSIKIPKGNGTIATIKFRPIGTTDTTLIYFDPDRTILASNGENILDYSNVLKITLR